MEGVDSGKPMDVIYLDFQKAFDKVPHKKLVYKLRKYGFDDRVIDWIGNWLKGRRQRVVIEGVYSGWESVLSGVPQAQRTYRGATMCYWSYDTLLSKIEDKI